MTLYEKFLGFLVLKAANRLEADEQSHFNVAEMSGPGKGKVRHVGGWAVRKLLENERKYAKDHMHTKDQQTLQKVAQCVANCDMIEETLLVPYARLETITSYPETLAITEARQFRERGLVHISDACFLMFLHLEQLRVDQMNSRKLLEYKEDLIANTFKVMTQDARLKALWNACFPEEDVANKKVSEEENRLISLKFLRYRFLSQQSIFDAGFKRILSRLMAKASHVNENVLLNTQNRNQTVTDNRNH